MAEIDEFKKYRIHDLYIKLRGSFFLSRLKEKLEPMKIGEIVILPFNIEEEKSGKTVMRGLKYDDIRPYCKDHIGIYVFLSCTMQKGNGMIAAFVYKYREKCDYIYEIVIQGEQYRHGINSHNDSDVTLLNKQSNNSKQDREKAEKLEVLWKSANINNSDFFQNIHGGSPISSDKYNKYAPECVYKYVKLRDGEKVYELLNSFADDIINVIPRL